RGVLSKNRVRQGAILLEAGKSQQNLFYFFEQASREQAPSSDESVAPPIQEPRVPGDDGFACASRDDKCAESLQQTFLKNVPRSHGRTRHRSRGRLGRTH